MLFGLLKEEAGEEVVVSPKFKLSPHQFEEIRACADAPSDVPAPAIDVLKV